MFCVSLALQVMNKASEKLEQVVSGVGGEAETGRPKSGKKVAKASGAAGQVLYEADFFSVIL